VPTRLVHSAKSWLSNPDVDRTAKILPWDSQETGECFLRWKFRRAFLPNSARSGTGPGRAARRAGYRPHVPASFDEEARELTVMAARDAGIERLTLLEEPAAAFYSWIANNLAQSRKKLFDARRCWSATWRRHQRLQPDSRFARWRPHQLHPHRGGEAPAAGRRQPGSDAGLAGGDQARREAFHPPAQRPAAPVLGRQGKAAQRSRLQAVEITVLGSGSSLIGKSLRSEIRREEALELALEGFLPFTERGEAPQEDARSLFRELGLPYVSDAAITRHLNAFLEPLGRRRTPFCSTAVFIRGFCAIAWLTWSSAVRPASGNSGEQRAGSGGGARRGVLLLRALHRQRRLVRGGLPRTYYIALARRAMANSPPSPWCRAARKRHGDRDR